MPFNHYAKIKRILDLQTEAWTIRKVEELTSAKNFKGQVLHYPYYYRIYDVDGEPIKYCKFQQIERLAHILKLPVEELPIVN